MNITVTKIRRFGCGPGAFDITWRTPGRWRKTRALLTLDREIIRAGRLDIAPDEAVRNFVHREVRAMVESPEDLQISIDSGAWRRAELIAAQAELHRFQAHPDLLPEMDERVVRGPWRDRDAS